MATDCDSQRAGWSALLGRAVAAILAIFVTISLVVKTYDVGLTGTRTLRDGLSKFAAGRLAQEQLEAGRLPAAALSKDRLLEGLGKRRRLNSSNYNRASVHWLVCVPCAERTVGIAAATDMGLSSVRKAENSLAGTRDVRIEQLHMLRPLPQKANKLIHWPGGYFDMSGTCYANQTSCGSVCYKNKYAPSGQEKPKVALVLAVCREDASWINSLSCDRFDKYVYSKCGASSLSMGIAMDCVTFTHLEGEGKQDLAYMYHIVQHYGNLHHLNVFVKGALHNEDKHSRGILNPIEKITELRECTGFAGLSKRTTWNDGSGESKLCWSNPKQQLKPQCRDNVPKFCHLLHKFTCKTDCPRWWTTLHSTFAVSAARIQLHPKYAACGECACLRHLQNCALRSPRREAYEEIRRMVQEEAINIDFIERLWNVIFGCWVSCTRWNS
eukprot:scaffold1722_cov380-Prasinococcus_capsulatus_cf.AAC.6